MFLAFHSYERFPLCNPSSDSYFPLILPTSLSVAFRLCTKKPMKQWPLHCHTLIRDTLLCCPESDPAQENTAPNLEILAPLEVNFFSNKFRSSLIQLSLTNEKLAD